MTRDFLRFNIPIKPSIDEFNDKLRAIWKSDWHTNNGLLLKSLEQELIKRFNHPYVVVVSSGTIALQMAVEILCAPDTDVITTPYTYIATSSSIKWQKRNPLYVDIDKNTWNIDTSLIEEKVGSNTSAILATHLYGNPCDTDSIVEIAHNRGLKVIYDASHCFDTFQNNKSIYLKGDISTASFHATKIFHTVEGGALFLKTRELYEKAVRMRNFGHNGLYEFSGVGINGKMSEYHAAMGLCILPMMFKVKAKRKLLYDRYKSNLKGIFKIDYQLFDPSVEYNYSYFPVLFKDIDTNELISYLRDNRVEAKKYFYPTLNRVYNTPDFCPVAERISNQVLCLPCYYDLSELEVDYICQKILQYIS